MDEKKFSPKEAVKAAAERVSKDLEKAVNSVMTACEKEALMRCEKPADVDAWINEYKLRRDQWDSFKYRPRAETQNGVTSDWGYWWDMMQP